MKHFLLALFLFPVYSFAQNLVLNPNFGEYSTCPNNFAQIFDASDWNSFGGTPDYFNSCDGSGVVGVPANYSGYQEPVTGNAYSGIVTFYEINFYREFLGGELSASLIPGNKYYVSLKVSFADSSNYATNNIGISFSTVAYSISNPVQINGSPKVHASGIITENNWTTVSGSFIADSSYKYIIIGNFYSDQMTDTLLTSTVSTYWSGFGYAYYYVGFVCLSSDSLECNLDNGINSYMPNENVNVYPNPASDLLSINLPSGTNTLIIFNVLGQEIYCTIGQKNKASIDVSIFSQGIYFLKVVNGNNILYKQFIIQK